MLAEGTIDIWNAVETVCTGHVVEIIETCAKASLVFRYEKDASQ